VASTTDVVLTWKDNSNDETSFRVENLAGGLFVEVQSLPAGTVTAHVAGLTPGAAYSFRVRAGNDGGFSGYSNTATITMPSLPPPLPQPPPQRPPAAPYNLVAQPPSASDVVLTWGDAAANETSFRIESKTGNGAFQEVQSVGANVTTARVSGLQPQTVYQLRVRSANEAGFSGYSNVVQVTTAGGTPTPTPTPAPGGGAPNPPNRLFARWLGGGIVQITWRDNSSNETRFSVERMFNGGWVTGAIVGPNVTLADCPGLKGHASYTFRVKVTNAAGQVAYSSLINFNTP
jgi:titin